MSRSSIALIVASIRGSVAGRKPTTAIIKLEASRAVEPTYWVKAPASSLQASRVMVSQISSRCCFQRSTRSDARSRSASSIARSSATQHMTLE